MLIKTQYCMHGNKLKSRLKFVEATSKRNRATSSFFSRRKSNSEIREDSHPNDSFDSFFDFEDDFSSQKPSRELFEESIKNEDTGICMEDIEINHNDCIIMEESLDLSTNFNDNNASSDILNDKSCMFIDNENVRCTSNKSNGSIFCSTHQIVGS